MGRGRHDHVKRTVDVMMAKMIASSALLLALLATNAAAGTIATAGENKMRGMEDDESLPPPPPPPPPGPVVTTGQIDSLTDADAAEVIEAISAYTESPMAIAVMDGGANLKAFKLMDGAILAASDSAIKKAK